MQFRKRGDYEFIKSRFSKTFENDLQMTHGYFSSTVTYKWAKLFYSSQRYKEKGKNNGFFESGFSKMFEHGLQLTHGFFSLTMTYKWAKLLCFN